MRITMANIDKPLPSWVTRWLWLSALLCIYDGLFCVLRPHTLPGGALETVYHGYKLYIAADIHYADATDSFIWSQGLLNLLESVVNLVVVLNLVRSVRVQKMVAVIVSVMTCWKTVLFAVYSLDIPKGGHKSDNLLLEILLVYGLGSLWIIVPALIVLSLSKDFVCTGKKRGNVSIGKEEEEEEEGSENDELDSSTDLRRRYNLRSSSNK